MMIKLIYVFTFLVIIYAYRNWFVSLCGLILMMAIIEHPDMPKSLGGIQGMNLWNLVLINVLVSWIVQRRNENLTWDMPAYINALLLLYLLVIIVSFLRAVVDMDRLPYFTLTSFISEDLINTLKWIIPGLLLYDGCRTQRRVKLALASILAVYFILSVQVIRWIPPQYVHSGPDLEARSRKIIQNEIGYSRVNMSMMLAGAAWATLSMLPIAKNRKQKMLVVVGFFFISYAQVLTGGRMGYGTWGLIGLILCLLRWRKYLFTIPVFVFFVFLFFPGVVERMTEGFNATSNTGEQYVSDYEITAGRTLMWPLVIAEINKHPLFGYGRQAMRRLGITQYLMEQYNESFPHPHNAYLELLLDNGLVGFLMVIPFYLVILVCATRLFFDDSFPLYTAIGGMTLAFLLALLIAGMGSQTFYPREGAVGLWASIGLAMRMTVERKRYLAWVQRPIQTPWDVITPTA
jgi:O-antigen ligase